MMSSGITWVTAKCFYFPYDSCHPHTLLTNISLLFSQGLISVILWHGKGHTRRSENNNKSWSLPAVEKRPLVYSCWESLLEFEIALLTIQNTDCLNIPLAHEGNIMSILFTSYSSQGPLTLSTLSLFKIYISFSFLVLLWIVIKSM